MDNLKNTECDSDDYKFEHVYIFENAGGSSHETLLYLNSVNKVDTFYLDYIKIRYGLDLIEICNNNPKNITVEINDDDSKQFLKNNKYLTITTEGEDLDNNSNRMFVTYSHENGIRQLNQVGTLINALAGLSILKYKSNFLKNSYIKYYSGRSLGDVVAVVFLFYDYLNSTKSTSINVECMIKDFLDLIFTIISSGEYFKNKYYGLTSLLLRNITFINHNNINIIINSIREELINYDSKIDTNCIGMAMNMIKDNLYIINGSYLALEITSYIINNSLENNKILNILESNHNFPLNDFKLFIRQCIDEYINKFGFEVKELKRTKYTSPVPVNTPWHSNIFKPLILNFKDLYYTFFDKYKLNFDLIINKYISSIIGFPFDISLDFCKEANKIIQSETLLDLINNWDIDVNSHTNINFDVKLKYNETNTKTRNDKKYIILIELLIHQYFSPNDWIKTMDYINKNTKSDYLTLVVIGLIKGFGGWLYKDTNYNVIYANEIKEK